MYYPITLDKERNFKFGMRALDMAEKKTGVAIMGLDLNTLTMNQIATLVWCGLAHEDKMLTVGNVMDIIDEYGDFPEVMRVLTEALTQAFAGKGKAEDDEKN